MKTSAGLFVVLIARACSVDPVVQNDDGNSQCYTDIDQDGDYSKSCGGLDCNDSDYFVSSDQEELCDGDDNDCDGQKDEGCNYHYTFSQTSITDWCNADLPFRPIYEDDLVTGDMLTSEESGFMYYYTSDQKRMVFPNSKTFETWYGDVSSCYLFNSVPPGLLASIPIHGNICYRPGVKLVKIETDPKLYAVGQKCTLRNLNPENQSELAEVLYGYDWEDYVEVIPDAFFTNYWMVDPINSAEEFDPEYEKMQAASINAQRQEEFRFSQAVDFAGGIKVPSHNQLVAKFIASGGTVYTGNLGRLDITINTNITNTNCRVKFLIDDIWTEVETHTEQETDEGLIYLTDYPKDYDILPNQNQPFGLFCDTIEAQRDQYLQVELTEVSVSVPYSHIVTGLPIRVNAVVY